MNKYVSVTGGGSHDGSSESNAYTMAEMFANLSEGNTYFVKAGNYGSTTYLSSASGTSTNPIKIIGYKATPGDIEASQGSTFVYGDTFSTADFPTLVGVRIGGDTVTGTGLSFTGNYVQVSNIQIKDHINGIVMTGNYAVADNIIITGMGDKLGSGTYSGNGLTITGNYSTLKNSFVLNPGAEGIRVYSGSYQTHSYNWVGCDDNTDSYATDYYYLVTTGSYNLFQNCTVWRKYTLSHQGHGFVLKGTGNNNVWNNCTVINTNFEIQQGHHNTIQNCFVENEPSNTAYNKLSHIMFANGAYENIVEKTLFTDGGGIRNQDWHETGDGAGTDNIVRDCEFRNVRFAIAWPWLWGPGAGNGLVIDSCTFDGVKDEMFRTERGNFGTIIRNCVFSNIIGVYNREVSDGGYYTYVPGQFPLDVTYYNCHFYNNAWATPSGISITTGDPLYTNRGGGDLSLTSESPLIGAGSLSTISVSDILGTTRGSSPDIGAYQYAGGSSTNPIITLTGASTINLTIGDSYVELGATATDVEDGNLTGSIVVTGIVNTAVEGTYYKYYNVTDSNSNAAVQVVRTIIVSEPGEVSNKTGIHKNLFWSI